MADPVRESLCTVGWRVSDQFVSVERSAKEQAKNDPAVLNELQRFELWATNLGLYHSGHSSLDYRVRDAPLVYNYALDLLRDLERALRQFQECLVEANAPSTAEKAVLDEEDSDEEDFSSYQVEPPTEAFFVNIVSTIDRLYRLAFKIRNPAMRLGLSKAKSYSEKDPETGQDLIEEFANFDLQHIQELFRFYGYSPADCEEVNYLIKRLAKANTRRRQQFRYWKKRREKYAAVQRPQPAQTTFELVERPSQSVPELRNMPAAPESSKPSTATWLNPQMVNVDDNASVVSSSTTIFPMSDMTGRDRVGIPPPPVVDESAKEFECPFCYTICPRKTLAKKAWETHIFHDLRPYLCTYKECRDPDQQYDSLHDWLTHETSCHSETGAEESSSTQTRNCLFCHAQNISVYHIAYHLRRIACFSLPRSFDDEEAPESTSKGSDGAQFDSDSSGGPSIQDAFSEPDKTDTWATLSIADIHSEEESGPDTVTEDANYARRLSSPNLPIHETSLEQYGLEEWGPDTVVEDANHARRLSSLNLPTHDTSSEQDDPEAWVPDTVIEDPNYVNRSRPPGLEQDDLEEPTAASLTLDLNNNFEQQQLFQAAVDGREDHIQELRSTGRVSLTERNQYGWTPLHVAANNGHTGAVLQLIDLHASDIDLKDPRGQTPLHLAAMKGHREVVRVLLEHGADPEEQDAYGDTPLGRAASRGHESVVEMLLMGLLNNSDSLNARGLTPLHLAASNGHRGVVGMLLNERTTNINLKDNQWQTPLHLATSEGHDTVVQMLIDRGASLEEQNDRGQTPLMVAASTGNVNVFKRLLATGKVDLNTNDLGARTPLCVASSEGHESIVRLLLQTGEVNLDEEGNDGLTPLFLAAMNGHESIVKMLLDTGSVDPDTQDISGKTPLAQAASNGHTAIVKLLLDTGKVDVTLKDNHGRTPLWWAEHNEHADIVKMLLDKT